MRIMVVLRIIITSELGGVEGLLLLLPACTPSTSVLLWLIIADHDHNANLSPKERFQDPIERNTHKITSVVIGGAW
jgi:hypothetical protein